MNSLICRLCENSEGNALLSIKQVGSKNSGKFEYIKCHDCNSLTIYLIPDDLSKYYENYYSLKPFKTHTTKKSIYKFKKFLLSKNSYLKKLALFNHHPLDSLAILSVPLSRLSNNAKILDVGSGSGKFVWDLVNLGYKKTIGLDPFIDQNIKYENGAKIIKKDLSEINGSYDLITFHHTFEHFFNLKESLICVKNLLKKTGICLIRIPNIDSFSAKEFGLDWTGIHAPYHLNLPSYKAMKKLLENAELKIDQIKGEQLPHFFFSNIDNKLNLIHDTSTMFRVFTESLSKIDKKYWKKQNKILNKTPLLCEWINYYVKLR